MKLSFDYLSITAHMKIIIEFSLMGGLSD